MSLKLGAVQYTLVTRLSEITSKMILCFMLEDIFPNGCTETELNDFLWFDDEYILSALNINQS